MPRDSGGSYTKPSGTTATAGQKARASQFNDLANDVATELTDSLSRSGKGAMQSLKDLSNNAMVSQLRALVDMGTNPLSVLKTASRLRSDYKARAKYEKVLNGLRSVTPGQPEAAVASVARPEDVAFVPGGMVMAYQRFLIEFYLREGQVKVIQQPSLHQLSRTYGGMFYLANTDWARCTPKEWREAVLELEHQYVPAYTPAYPSSGSK